MFLLQLRNNSSMVKFLSHVNRWFIPSSRCDLEVGGHLNRGEYMAAELMAKLRETKMGTESSSDLESVFYGE